MDTVNLVVGAVVVCDDSILLLQRSNHERFLPGRWGVPAGKVHYGESLEQAVLRELGEEAGLVGKIVGMVGTKWFSSKCQGQQVNSIQVNFVVLTDSCEVRLDSSSQDHRWISWRDVDNAPVPVDSFTRDILSQARGSLSEVVVV